MDKLNLIISYGKTIDVEPIEIFSLKVPYERRYDAAALRATWSPEQKIWYFETNASEKNVRKAEEAGFQPTRQVMPNYQAIAGKMDKLAESHFLTYVEKDAFVALSFLELGFNNPVPANQLMVQQDFACPCCLRSKGELLSRNAAKKRWALAAVKVYAEEPYAICSKCLHGIQALPGNPTADEIAEIPHEKLRDYFMLGVSGHLVRK